MGRTMGLLGTVSALGTALGPSLGGFLLPLTGWTGIFFVQIPFAALALVMAIGSLPAAAEGRLQQAAALPALPGLSLLPNLFINLLVAAIMMTTLVVGPFYLGLGLALPQMVIGLVMSVGPVISIFSGIPSGQAVDIWGAQRVLMLGLFLLAAGAFLLTVLPQSLGIAGYILAIAVLTPGYQLFQSANNTAVMATVPQGRRGTVSGLLSLSRNIGLVLGASAMGAVFAFGVGTSDLERAAPASIANGMKLTFLLAGGLMLGAICIAVMRSPRQAVR